MATSTKIEAKDGDRLDTLCYLAYGELKKVYTIFLEAQNPNILRKGILEAGDEVLFPIIDLEDEAVISTRFWE